MSVRLISITKPELEDLKNATPEELMVYVARVSNPKNQLNLATAPKLLEFCIKHGHWSVFEHVFVTFEITTTRAIAAQILRHKSAFFQEFSLRYSKSTTIQKVEARLQDTKNRQNSIETDEKDLIDEFDSMQDEVIALCLEKYKRALDLGVAKEQARFLLPLSTQTTLYMTNNVRNWMHYIDLRSGNGTQKEHQEIALAIKEQFIKLFPNISKAKKYVE